MPSRLHAFAGVALLTCVITACVPTPAAPHEASPAPTPSTSHVPARETPATTAVPEQEQVAGTVVRFASDRTSVDVTIGEDSPGVRDFLSLLPLELTIEEFAGAEKIAYLPRELNYEGSPGSDPEDGDLIYFTPWGNLGFYYDTTGVGYSDATLHIGTYTATEEQLSLLEGGPVSITVVD
ncbi:hypothetical protein M2317_001783 [Microbacterium sp. ZKA21]|uniref:cyclophilin-like fold protein n=1 Tax=Microbacterium sp. ZKA21 TaxID=3381694 RepID=UPI003D1C6B1D